MHLKDRNAIKGEEVEITSTVLEGFKPFGPGTMQKTTTKCKYLLQSLFFDIQKF